MSKYYVQIIKTCLYMSALYLLHILYNVLSIKVSDNKVYMIHVHLYRSGPIWLGILYTKITGDNSLYKILIPNITYKINYLTCRVIQTKIYRISYRTGPR